MKLATLLLALFTIAAGIAAAGASATPSSNKASSNFCSVARGVAHDIVTSTSIANGHAVPANVKVVFTTIAANEPALLSSAPARMKVHLRPVFGFVNLAIADFEKANWNLLAMAPYRSALVARAQAVGGHVQALRVYFHTKCNFDV
jgi:hypothetical protein